MQTPLPRSSTSEHDVSGATRPRTRTRSRESTYTTVSWDYPPSPAAYYDALLARGASYSRFLRIAYLSTRHRLPSSPSCPPFVSSSPSPSPGSLDTLPSPSDPHHASTTPSADLDGLHRKPALHLPPIPPYPLSRSCANAQPRSANLSSHTLKRRKPQWPKPPHYHAGLLRAPLSHRKGLFRAVLPPSKAVDFFRWDVLFGGSVSWTATSQERDWMDDDVGWAALRVAEEALAPYEAAAGFFGWHGLGLVARRVRGKDDERCWREGPDSVSMCGSVTLQFEIDEAVVEQGRARWAREAEELVGPPGLVLRSVAEHTRSGKVTSPLDSAYSTSSISSRREELRWNPDMGTSSTRPPGAVATADGKRRSSHLDSTASVAGSSPISKTEPKSDSPLAWGYGPSPHRGPPPTSHVPSVRFMPPSPLQYGPPPVQFSSWFPGGRPQGHGYWYGAQPVGVSSSVSRDSNPKTHPPHSHVYATPATPASVHPAHSPRYPTKRTWDEYGPGHDDKETETDHGYESTTTTTDSDPPPHTPVGTITTSHCIQELQLHGDDEVEVHGVEINSQHAAASMTVRLSDPSTSVKFLDRFSAPASPPLSSGSLDSHREGCESSKAAVVFPSLNGSFRQGLAVRVAGGLASPGMSSQATPAGTVTPVSSSLLSSTKESTEPCQGDEGDVNMKHEDREAEGSNSSVSGDGPAFTLIPCSPPLTSPRPGLRKDSQGFWESMTSGSPSSSSFSLPRSPCEGKTGRRSTMERIGDESPEEDSLPCMLSPSPRRVTSEGSICSSSSRLMSLMSPVSTTASDFVLGGSHASSPSPPSLPANPTTLLPAFLATTGVKRKKTSRTREIVDRLRSSSVDAGKDGVDGLGWLAGVGEGEGKVGKAIGSERDQPSRSSAGSELGKGAEGQGSKTVDSPMGKSGGTTHASSRATAMTTNAGITPFPILSVSPSQACNFTPARQGQAGGMNATASKGAEGIKVNATVGTSPTARSSGPALVPSTPIGTSPSARPVHHPLPSPTHPAVHPPPALGPPPPILAVSAYPHPMYVPYAPQYHVAPAHQGQPGQGTWVAVYPGRPPHVPVHPIPAPLTGVSGMRHVSW